MGAFVDSGAICDLVLIPCIAATISLIKAVLCAVNFSFWSYDSVRGGYFGSCENDGKWNPFEVWLRDGLVCT